MNSSDSNGNSIFYTTLRNFNTTNMNIYKISIETYLKTILSYNPWICIWRTIKNVHIKKSHLLTSNSIHFQGAAQTVQNVIKAGQRATNGVYSNGSGASG
jgi:hypothetical protein